MPTSGVHFFTHNPFLVHRVRSVFSLDADGTGIVTTPEVDVDIVKIGPIFYGFRVKLVVHTENRGFCGQRSHNRGQRLDGGTAYSSFEGNANSIARKGAFCD